MKKSLLAIFLLLNGARLISMEHNQKEAIILRANAIKQCICISYTQLINLRFNQTAHEPVQEQMLENYLEKSYQELSRLVTNNSNLLNDQEKTKLVTFENLHNCRKQIIKTMIEKESLSPNDIESFDGTSAIYQAIAHKDREFTKYLLEHKATIDQKTSWLALQEWNSNNPAVILLLKSATHKE